MTITSNETYFVTSVYAFFFVEDDCTGVATAAPKSNRREDISLRRREIEL
jgi:hypothetical protein